MPTYWLAKPIFGFYTPNALCLCIYTKAQIKLMLYVYVCVYIFSIYNTVSKGFL